VKGVQKKAFREVVEKYGLNAIITAEQDLVLTGIDPADRPAVQATLEAAGLDTEAGAGANATNRLDKQAIACPALPLCGLAMSEAERGLPDVNARLVALLDRMGLGDESFVYA
jgi:sulfite reductase (ferredoxin)